VESCSSQALDDQEDNQKVDREEVCRRSDYPHQEDPLVTFQEARRLEFRTAENKESLRQKKFPPLLCGHYPAENKDAENYHYAENHIPSEKMVV
jgi:hypothetical protein